MDQGAVMQVGRQGLEVALMVSLPLLAVSLFLGLAVSVFQAVTQVQEATLTFVPKLFGIGIVMTFMGGWMLTTLVSFMNLCFQHVARIGH
jgi:flagellar biosynthetic protein FliQ